MALFETDAIILRSFDLNDADRIIVALTRDHGVIRGVAKGAKRSRSKFGSGLEPFSVIRLDYFRKESAELASINRSEIVRSNFAIAGDIDFLESFSYIAELVTTFSPPDDPNELLYRLVDSCLSAAESPHRSPDAFIVIVLYFQTWVMSISGLLPDLTICGHCGREAPLDESIYFRDGHNVLCSRCDVKRVGAEISWQAREFFTAVRCESPISIVNSYGSRINVIRDAAKLFSSLIDRSAGREIRPAIMRR